ncbi:unannotated protein [freshwater metagenome]|uniref:Unannotated protein n=1 Tax=freshwater metagenome TaxID=449393 RepID=A0A6J7PYB6_9ZZZZ
MASIALPRPIGLTGIRATSSIVLSLSIWTIFPNQPHLAPVIIAVVATAAAFALASSSEVARWCVEGSAYGDESRFPLKTPPSLLVTLVPLSIALAAAGTLVGPVLLAQRHWVAGVIALAIGAPLAYAAVRSLHLLSKRFAVVVPAGFVIADPMTLSDPILFVREHIVALEQMPSGARVEGALDLRLGAASSSLLLRLDDVAPLTTRKRGTAVQTPAQQVLFSPRDREALIARCAERRIKVA